MKKLLIVLFIVSSFGFAQDNIPTTSFECKSKDQNNHLTIRGDLVANKVTIDIDSAFTPTKQVSFDFAPKCWDKNDSGVYVMGDYLDCVIEGVNPMNTIFKLNMTNLLASYKLSNFLGTESMLLELLCETLE